MCIRPRSQHTCLYHFWSHFLPFQIDTTIFIFVNFFHKMATGGHFGCPKITFGRISDRLRNCFLFEIFDKMAAGGHFGCPKFTFDRISGHFISIRNFFLNFWQKGRCPKITFDRISDYFRQIGHFGCQIFTFDRISAHFRSIRNSFFRRPFWISQNHFRSMAISDRWAILGVRKSLLMAFLDISFF